MELQIGFHEDLEKHEANLGFTLEKINYKVIRSDRLNDNTFDQFADDLELTGYTLAKHNQFLIDVSDA